jgi:hypothetical protein
VGKRNRVTKEKRKDLQKRVKEVGIKIKMPGKGDFLDCLLSHIRMDNLCECNILSFPAQEISSYVKSIAVLVTDIETDGYGNNVNSCL